MSSSPDTSGQNAAALQQSQIAQEAWNFYKQEAGRTQGLRDQATRTAAEAAQQQLDNMRDASAWARDDRKYAVDTFRPVEQRMVASAAEYDSPERRNAAAIQAASDVQASLAGNRAATMRALARRGASPSNGRLMAMQDMQDIGGALASASAQNQARRGIEQQGWARMADVANLGRGTATASAAQLGAAGQLGAGAAGSAGQATNLAMSGANMMNQSAGSAIGGLGSAGNMFGQVANAQAQSDAANNQTYAGLASAAMMAVMV